uniref:Uncharacterized protein n=1 Tax=uncultured bacterium contig00016 TaxID=1181507 RepID=A0A806KE29_9BACT|nr:hypothetical protein [uncultured bacterium contig00016]
MSRRIILSILLIGGIVVQAFAQNVVAVLEIVPSSGESALTIQEFRHLTDELRTQARNALPRSGYTILTRDNIIQLLPPDEAEAECLAESCAVDIGRAIGAEYVTQGFVGSFQGMLTLTVELYESMSGNMLGSFVTESEDAKGLLGTIREKAPALFAKLSEPGFSGLLAFGGSPTNDERRVLMDLQDSVEIPAKPQPQVPSPQSQRAGFWIAIGLDIIGAAALGFGIYKHIDANGLHSEYKKKPDASGWTESDFDEFGRRKSSELKKVNDARRIGNIGLMTGGAFFAAGLMVHVWF